jgi:cytochrome c
MRRAASPNLLALLCFLGAMTVSVRASQRTAPVSSEGLLPSDVSGEEIYRQACAACHHIDGSGQPQSVVGSAFRRMPTRPLEGRTRRHRRLSPC